MKNKLLKRLILPMFLLLGSFIYGQTVTGTVSDNSGPLPGVNVLVKGTSTGTQTDFDGNYTLNNVDSDAVIVYSFLGYRTQEIAVNGQSTINVILEEDAAQLDEVVVIGYGTTTVKDATGSVASVTSEDFNRGVISSPEQLIQGKTSGVQITQTSGEPGAGITLRIRGTGSVRANNSPLFVIDGVPVSNEEISAEGADVGVGSSGSKNPLNFLNPNDIESISILKDASSTAIYGSRGANGVVVITTKSGRSGGDGQWSFSSSLSLSETADRYGLLKTDEFIARGGADLGGGIDWQNFIFRSPGSTDNTLSYSRNYGGGNVRATFGYSKQYGVIENTDLERISGRINANHRFFDDKLNVSLQTTFSRVKDRAPFISRTSGSTGDLLASAYYSNPTLTDDPDFNTGPDRNPANLLAYYDDNTDTDRFLGNLSLDYAITDEIAAKVTLGYDTSDSFRGQVVGPQIIALDNGPVGNGRAAVSNLETENKLLELTATFNKEFENSKLDVLVGYSFQDFNRRGQDILGQGYRGVSDLGQIVDITERTYNATRNIASDYQAYGIGVFSDTGLNEMRVLSLFPGPTDTALPAPSIKVDALTVDTFNNTDELQSFFGRVNYSIQDKYLFTATFRADGSSRFGGNNQYGYFPSAAFAWKLNEEDFTGDAFSTLKLRLNWGITGNQDGLGYGNFVNRTRWLENPTADYALNILSNSQITGPATTEVAFANADLKWEETTQYGFGIDFGFNNDRFTGTLDFYRKETRDILLNLPSVQPATVPFVFQNVDAVIVNQGFEIGLDYDIVQTEDFTWNANLNVAYNDNELTDYDGPDIQAGRLYGQGLTLTTVQIFTEGQSLFTYNLRQVDSDFNVDADPSLIEGKSGLPDVTAGFSTSANYKNWSAALYFSGQFGHYVYNNTANALFASPQLGSRNNLKSVVDEGIILSATNPSTFFLEKGDFVRLQSASVSYNVPLSGEGTLSSLRLSLSGQNLFLITDYSGLDPEVSTTDIPDNGFPSASIDYVQYPRPRTYTLGITATF